MFESQLRFWPDPILNIETDLWDFQDPPFDPHELAEAMTLCMQRMGGIGLSANQFGQPYRVMIMQLQNGVTVSMFNPKLLWASQDLWPCPEGCLSFPGQSVTVARSRTVKAGWQDALGQEHVDVFHDIDAKCFLHELDHLNGVTMESRFTAQQLEDLRKRSAAKHSVYYGTDRVVIQHAMPGVDMKLTEICLLLNGRVTPSSHMMIGAFTTLEERFEWVMHYLRSWNFPWWLDFNLSNRWLIDSMPGALLARFDWSGTEQHWLHERMTKRHLNSSMPLRLLSRGPKLFFIASYNYGTFQSFVSRIWERPRVIMGHNSCAWLSWRHGILDCQEQTVLQPRSIMDQLGESNVFVFDVNSFFDTHAFCDQMQNLNRWLDLPSLPLDKVAQIHLEYLKTCERVKHLRSKIKHTKISGAAIDRSLGDQFPINYQHRLEPYLP
jgi:peptide deformylase